MFPGAETNTPFGSQNAFDTDSPFGVSSPFAVNNGPGGFALQAPADGCVQCGICLSSCPTFARSGDPEQSPMGRIRLMRALENDGGEGMALEKLESCLGCYSCETVCPSRVDYGNRLDTSLARLRERRPLPALTRKMLLLADKRSLLKRLMQAGYLAQLFGLRGLMERLGLFRLFGLQRANALLGPIRFPTSLSTRPQRAPHTRRVALFTGCFSSVMEQAVQQAAIDIFNALGLEVLLPEGQGCCGALHRHNGELKTAARLARRNIAAFADTPAEAIVTTSSGCGAGLKAYDKWLEEEGLTTPVMDVSHYLATLLQQRQLVFGRLPLKVAVHTPCTLRQGEGQEEAVMELLQQIPGLEIVPLSGMPRCCGAGGSQMLSQPEMADALRDDIVSEVKATQADVLISSNLGCAMHLREGLAQAGLELPVQHPVQLIARAMVVEFVSVRNG